MTNELTRFLKRNQKDIVTFGIIGAGVYLLSKNFLPSNFSTLQSSFGEGVLDKVVNLEIQTLLLFIVLGIAMGLIISGIVRRPLK